MLFSLLFASTVRLTLGAVTSPSPGCSFLDQTGWTWTASRTPAAQTAERLHDFVDPSVKWTVDKGLNVTVDMGEVLDPYKVGVRWTTVFWFYSDASLDVYSSVDGMEWALHGSYFNSQNALNRNVEIQALPIAMRFFRVAYTDQRCWKNANCTQWGIREIVVSNCTSFISSTVSSTTSSTGSSTSSSTLSSTTSRSSTTSSTTSSATSRSGTASSSSSSSSTTPETLTSSSSTGTSSSSTGTSSSSTGTWSQTSSSTGTSISGTWSSSSTGTSSSSSSRTTLQTTSSATLSTSGTPSSLSTTSSDPWSTSTYSSTSPDPWSTSPWSTSTYSTSAASSSSAASSGTSSMSLSAGSWTLSSLTSLTSSSAFFSSSAGAASSGRASLTTSSSSSTSTSSLPVASSDIMSPSSLLTSTTATPRSFVASGGTSGGTSMLGTSDAPSSVSQRMPTTTWPSFSSATPPVTTAVLEQEESPPPTTSGGPVAGLLWPGGADLWERLEAGEVVRQQEAAASLLEVNRSATLSSGGVRVTVPASVWSRLSDGGQLGKVAVVLAVLNGTTALVEGARRFFAGAETRLGALVGVELVSSKQGVLNVSGLEEPVEIAMPVSAELKPTCAFWQEEEQAWSMAGVATVQDWEEVRCLTVHLSLFGALIRGFVNSAECSAALSLLTWEALARLWTRDDWARRRSSALFFAVLAWWAMAMSLAASVDARYSWGPQFFLANKVEERRSGGEEEELASDQGSSQDEEEFGYRCAIWVSLSSLACCQWLRGSTACRDAADEIFNNWFEYFAEARDLFESVLEAFEMRGGAAAHLRDLNARVTAHIMMLSIRRVVAASLGVSDKLVSFVMRDKDLSMFLMADRATGEGRRLRGSLTVVTEMLEAEGRLRASFCHERTPEAGVRRSDPRAAFKELLRAGGARAALGALLRSVPFPTWGDRAAGAAQTVGIGVQESPVEQEQSDQPAVALQPRASIGILERGVRWRRTPDKREAWAVLHREVGEGFRSAGELFLERAGLLRMVLRIFAVRSPLSEAFFFDPAMSSKLRTFFVGLDVLGAVMLTVVFFEAAGKRGSKAQCGQGDFGLAFEVGQLLAAVSFSVAFAALPVGFLASLHTKRFRLLERNDPEAWGRQMRAWALQDRLIWLLGSAYALCCLLVVLLFLANMEDGDDEAVFLQGVALALMQTFVVVPLGVALVVPMFGWLALYGNHICGCVDRRRLLRRVHERATNDTNIMLPIVAI